MGKQSKFLLADLALILAAVIWGLNFTFTKFSISLMPPMEFTGLRYIISAAILGVFFFKILKTTTRSELRAGCVIGIFLFIGSLAQIVGLLYTTPGKSGFISTFYIVIVPFLVSFLHKKFVGWMPIGGAILAFIGLCLISISMDDISMINKGDLLSLVCAFFYALQILAVEHYAPRYNVYNLTIIQIAFTGILSMGYSVVFESMTFQVPGFVWGALIYTIILGTCIAYLIQNIAQKYTSSSKAALLYGLEAPLALLFSILIWGETITARGLLGCTLIFVAIIFVVMGPTIMSVIANTHQKLLNTISHSK
ncbi:DMT family transporter [Desulfosporosinus sp. Sb-LF]|uniref:DMT family transporter n=1 Tax=Desulfosporosinus sp. Sb-LF TaxID=2560027 RepID=UPI00107FAF70|nr:DMT family transporter [Desulfosporosinus sp. Sb-LF]TGE33378.1 DMT family transporter [Desulfosporosinus sp. Sb-LF]